MHEVPEYKFLETRRGGTEGRVMRIMLNRPHVRNAQNRGMLVELDDALLGAEADDSVHVVVLGGEGPSFSSGHDLGSKESLAETVPGPAQHASRREKGGQRRGNERVMLQEWHHFFSNTVRWRNLRKITIAEVHGDVLSAGLMLAWACDLIVAADDARFSDVVATRLGMQGVEYFAHPWEFGPRLAKHLLLTGDSISADEAHRLGMLASVHPREDLQGEVDALADQISHLPTMTSLLIKESVNQTQDAMGFSNALQACFSLHQLNHSFWGTVSDGERWVGSAVDGLEDWKKSD